MKLKLTFLILIITCSALTYSRVNPDGDPEKFDIERQEKAAKEEARKKAEAEARATAFDIRTKNTIRELERNAINKLADNIARSRQSAKNTFKNDALVSANTEQLNQKSYEISFSNTDVDLNKVKTYQSSLQAKIANLITNFYSSEVSELKNLYLTDLKK